MRPHPKRTSTNVRSPRAWGTCDRSGFVTNHEKLVWQFDWRGTQLVNLRVLVAPDMLDKPQRQLGTIILPPDPVSIINARPEQYTMEEQTFLVDEAATQQLDSDEGFDLALMGDYVPQLSILSLTTETGNQLLDDSGNNDLISEILGT